MSAPSSFSRLTHTPGHRIFSAKCLLPRYFKLNRSQTADIYLHSKMYFSCSFHPFDWNHHPPRRSGRSWVCLFLIQLPCRYVCRGQRQSQGRMYISFRGNLLSTSHQYWKNNHEKCPSANISHSKTLGSTSNRQWSFLRKMSLILNVIWKS